MQKNLAMRVSAQTLIGNIVLSVGICGMYFYGYLWMVRRETASDSE